MKRSLLLTLFILIACVFAAKAQDYILLPENFFLNKGEKLKVHLIHSTQFLNPDELKYQSSQTTKLMLYSGSKKIDLIKTVKDSITPIVSYDLESTGLAMIDMNRKYVINEVEKEDYLKYLDDEGLTKASEKTKSINKDNIREKYTWFLKSLFYADKPSGNIYEKPTGDEYEILLLQNPYKFNYGDDVTAQVNLKGKPLVNATVLLYIKTVSGNVFPQKLSTDGSGQIYFKLSREGIYLLRSLYVEPSKDKNTDFETWVASFTFAFSSSNQLPNTYKEFGFGNKH